MPKRFLVCSIMVLVAACALDVEIDAPMGAVEDATEDRSEAELESCMLAESLDDGELAVTSCLLRAPVNAQGEVVVTSQGVAAVPTCTTYYGSCTGVSGCSKASGGAFSFTKCGSFLYAWLTVCGDRATDVGSGFCFW